MGKINKRVLRKDTTEDHCHGLEDKKETGGMLLKPAKDRMQPHTHLYQHDGKTYETGLAPNDAGHTHDYQPEPGHEYAETSGPKKCDKGLGKEIPRNE